MHDLGEYLSTDASGGVAYAAPAEDPHDELLLPIGSAFIRYAKDRYSGQAGYHRTVATTSSSARRRRRTWSRRAARSTSRRATTSA